MMLAPGVRGAIVDADAAIHAGKSGAATCATSRRPRYLIWGDKDGMIPFSNAQDYLRAILQQPSRFAFPDVGHIPQEEAPAAVAGAGAAVPEGVERAANGCKTAATHA